VDKSGRRRGKGKRRRKRRRKRRKRRLELDFPERAKEVDMVLRLWGLGIRDRGVEKGGEGERGGVDFHA